MTASWATARRPIGRYRFRSRLRGRIAAALLLAACSSDVTGPNSRRVDDILISPDTTSVVLGSTVTLSAQPVSSSGSPINNLPIFWSTSDPTIATVTQGGVVSGIALGKVTIDASTSGVSPKHPAQITVVPVPVASIVVAPGTITLRVGTSSQLTDTTKDAGGHALTGRTVTWSISDTSIAGIDQSGFVVARKPGTATVTATFGKVTGTATVTVTLVPVSTVGLSPASPSVIVGQTTQLSATTKDSAGNVLTGRTITWFSRDSTIATIDPTGTVTGVRVGSVTIGATAGGVTATTTLVVQAVPVNTVVMSPASSNLLVGQTQTLTAEVTDNAGHRVPGATVTFTSSATGVATVTATGPVTATVTAVGAGQAQVTGTSGSKSGSASVNVTLVPIASIAITPAFDSITIGGTAQLTATLKDSVGNTLTGRTVTWSSSNSGVATVSGTGVVAGVSAGTVGIVATAGGKVSAASVTVKPIAVGSVAISPKTVTLTPGAQTQLSVTVKDSLGNVIQNPAVTWTSTATGVALVNGSGLVIGTTPGTALIIAQSGSKADTNTTTVIPAPTASITITPNPVTIIVGQTAVLTATQKDANGTVLSGRSVTWQSPAPNTVSVSAGGVDPITQLDTCTATAVAAGGPIAVVAQAGHISASTQVTVSNVPVAYVLVTPNLFSVDVRFTRQVVAKAFDANNNLLSGRQFTWSTKSGGRISSVDQTGLVTGVAAGSDSVSATTGGKTGAGAVTVALAPVATVIVAPPASTITAAQTVQLSDTVKDSQGDTLQGRTVTWVSSNTTIATVSATGLVQPKGGLNDSGTVTITATSGSVHGTATVTITQDPVAKVTVSPSSSTINASHTQQLTATLQDASGATITGRPVAWFSSNPSVATVSNTGLVSPTGANDSGTVTITATSGTASGTATVTIGQDPVASIHITPASSSIDATQTQQLTATLTDSNNTTLTGRTVTWSSSDPTIATVSNTGLVTPTGANDSGTVTITARSGGKAANATVTITQDPVATVTLAPSSSSIAATQTQQLTATLKDAGGTVLTGRTITWSSSNTSVATVSASGLVSPTGLNDTGTVTITATSGTAMGTATVTITADPVTSVTVAPPSSSISATQTQQLTATLKDAGGTVLTGRAVTWSSSNTGVATVSPSGLVSPTGVNDSGTVTITATSGTASGTATVAITADPVASVTVAPPTSTITTSQTQQLGATLKDAGGTVLTGRPVTWSSSNPGIATVSNTGLVQPVGAVNDTGTITITATSGTASGTATVDVTNVLATAVSVNPPGATIFATSPSNQIQLGATTTPAGLGVTWSNGGSSVATVDGNGLVTATGTAAGPVTITATSANSPASGSSSITVIGHVGTVTVNAGTNALSVSSATSTTANATLLDTFGTDVSAQREVTWTSSDGSTIQINGGSGPFVANPATTVITLQAVSTNSPTVTITATTDDGVSGSITITVSP
ncbi:MAG TPA: Ig-like domain-containing protein [Gemmatimonadaceae bacterium]|nr:Ig-like domain-containing protein [Gemmatimonadaceae bacterium]